MTTAVKHPAAEIGGYFELEKFSGEEYYPDLLHFNLGRTAAAYFLKQAGCKTILMPYFMCDSVTQSMLQSGIRLQYYHIQADFTPDPNDLPDSSLPDDTWLYLNDSYGLLSDEVIHKLHKSYGNVLLDFTHSFFRRPPAGLAAVTSIRKFLGVTDGAYLQSDRPITLPDTQDQSHTRFSHVLGRYETNAGAFYQQMLDNAHTYDTASAKSMSALTKNLLCAIPYEEIAEKRRENAAVLSHYLDAANLLLQPDSLKNVFPGVTAFRAVKGLLSLNSFCEMLHRPGPFVYPMLVRDGSSMRKALAARSIFVPTYWSEIAANAPAGSIESCYAANILALPCDQRYGQADMEYLAATVLELLS